MNQAFFDINYFENKVKEVNYFADFPALRMICSP